MKNIKLLKGDFTMNTNHEKPVNEASTDHTGRSGVDSSRRAFSRFGITALPAVLTLTSKTALGTPYLCTVSGMQSGNLSSHPGQPNCGVGFSPGGWWQNANNTGNSDGNLNQWLAAGVNPFSIRRTRVNGVFQNQVRYQGIWRTGVTWEPIYGLINNRFGNGVAAHTFSSVFGGTNSRSLWDVLDQQSGSLEFHAIAVFLNARLNQVTGQFNPIYLEITPAYIVSIYNSTSLSADQKKAYFEMLQH
ncbi:MAG: hypothetical protein CTY17_04920 [Methylomonas sp.]|nr:MAG: hypothetical protein CTY17_04920 [Methylomonas sp.]